MAQSRVSSSLLLGFVVACLSAVTGCEAGVDSDETQLSDEVRSSLSTPQWTWLNVPGSMCSNGTETGFAYNQGTGSDLVIFFEGGGACWNEQTCVTTPTADHLRGYDAALFRKEFADESNAPTYAGPLTHHSFFDRSWTGNPHRNASYVYVPYCTGDLQSGAKTAQFSNGTFHFAGRTNIEKFVPEIYRLFGNASRVTVAGRSAGGFGSAISWWRFKEQFAGRRVDLIDDSGPPLDQKTMTGFPTLGGFDRMSAAWDLQGALPSACAACRTNIRNVVSYYSETYPDSRFALLSYDQDLVIGALLGQLPSVFAGNLNNLNSTVVRPLPNVRYFVPAANLQNIAIDLFKSIPSLLMNIADPAKLQTILMRIFQTDIKHTMVHNWDLEAGSLSLGAFLNAMYSGSSTWSNKTETGVTCPGGTGNANGRSEAKYIELGACGSELGAPTSSEGIPPDLTGRYTHFQNGSIYWHPNTGAHEIRGAIRSYWASRGYELSPWGYAVSDTLPTSTSNGSKNVFQGGGIYSHPSYGTHGVRGAIWSRYASLGADASALGLPTSDEYPTGFLNLDRKQNFERGSIYWSAIGGTSYALR